MEEMDDGAGCLAQVSLMYAMLHILTVSNPASSFISEYILKA